MVRLPKQFVATKYPGYFWNTDEKKLYSLKVTGELRPIKFNRGGLFYGRQVMPGYPISVNGKRRTYTMEYLGSLKPTKQIQEIGVV